MSQFSFVTFKNLFLSLVFWQFAVMCCVGFCDFIFLGIRWAFGYGDCTCLLVWDFFSLLFIHFFFCLFLLLLIYWDNKSEKCPGMPQISEAASLSPISGNLNWFVSGYPNLLSPDSLDSVESFQWFPPPSISRLSFTFGTLLWLCLPFDVLWWRHACLQLFA